MQDFFASMKKKIGFLLLILIALLLPSLPVIHWPFAWLETFFHEWSHGMVAWLTGGLLHRIELHWSGAGLCHTSGGDRSWVLWSGYAGSVFWGMTIYLSASVCQSRYSSMMTALLLAVLAATALLWVEDETTWTIMAIMALFLLWPWRRRQPELMKLLLRFSGLYVLMDAVRSPLQILATTQSSDALLMAQIHPHIPPSLWWLSWELTALCGLWLLWRMTCQRNGSAINR
ncbi:MAG: M50 family metallopeptidase [Magnetococcales bacterium]|nr:M50 family metallopeptidase [Magnetococcales bacterium]